MGFHPEPLPAIPEVIAAVVRAAFPKGNLYVDLRMEFGILSTDQLFADLPWSRDKHPIGAIFSFFSAFQGLAQSTGGRVC